MAADARGASIRAMFQNVIIGIDGGDGDLDALALARRLSAPDARFTLAHVWGPREALASSITGERHLAAVGRQLLEGAHARSAAGGRVGTLATLASPALLGLSGYLLARAAQAPPILTLSAAIVSVRFFGLLRAVAR